MKVKEFREKKGYTQEKLAKILNVKRSSVATWEAKKDCIPRKVETLKRIALLFNCTIDELLED